MTDKSRTGKDAAGKGAAAKGAAAKGAAAKGAADAKTAAKRTTATGKAPKDAASKGAAAKGAPAKSSPAKGATAKRATAGSATAMSATANSATAKSAMAKGAATKGATASAAARAPTGKGAAPRRTTEGASVRRATPARAVRSRVEPPRKAKPGILAVDVGGTGLKCAVIDDEGNMLSERARVATPHPCPPQVLLDTYAEMVKPFPAFDRIAIGFPGVVRDGTVLTAPNLGTDAWAGFALASAMSKRLGGHPARLINDAEMQGLGIVSGKGLELVMTLGTGVGTALFRDGVLMPHMELAHHPISGDKTYDEYLGNAAYEAKGKKRWNKRVAKAIDLLYTLLHYDRLYLGGGNDKHVELKLPDNVIIASNDAGLTGGAMLWKRPI